MQLLIAALMMAATVLIHLAGLTILVAMMERRPRGGTRRAVLVRQDLAIMAAAFGLSALHAIEIWAYAALYLGLGALPEFGQALYFSTSGSATIGCGDVVLPIQWHILGLSRVRTGSCRRAGRPRFSCRSSTVSDIWSFRSKRRDTLDDRRARRREQILAMP